MLDYLKRFFSKNGAEEDIKIQLPGNANAKFELKIDSLVVGTLQCEGGEWIFKYSEEFKQHSAEYNHIAGFSKLDKVYHNEMLWPFFQTRIPGLKQPAVKEIIEKEHINVTNELELLKRFGRKTISNPYELDLVF